MSDHSTLGKLLESLEAGWFATETGPETDRAIAAALRRTLYGTDTEPGLVERVSWDATNIYVQRRLEHGAGDAFLHALRAEIGDGRGTPREGEGE